jgi:hypothetical protein
LVRFFHSLAETETLLKNAAHPRYQLEIGLVKLMEMRRLESLSQLLERLSSLEEALRTGKAPAGNRSSVPGTAATRSAPSPGSPAPASMSKPGAASTASAGRSETAAASGAAAAAGSYSSAATKTALEAEASAALSGKAESGEAGYAGVADAVMSEIEQIKAALEKRRKMFLVTALEGARVARLEGNKLCVEFAPDNRHLRDTLAKSENVKILREVCKQITDRDLGVRFVISDGEVPDAPPTKEENEWRERQSLREQAEKDPTVQQMLKTFRGEIVDVKRADPKK